MANYQILNKKEHRHIKVDNTRSSELGDGVMSTIISPHEFRNVQSNFPIFFQKAADSEQMFPIALLGFETGENLFINGDNWQANYIPETLLRHPFAIANADSQMLTIDMDSPRVNTGNTDNGEPLFLEHGGNSEYLTKITELMGRIHQGFNLSKKFVDCLQNLGLIEPLTLKIALNDNSTSELLGFYTINEDQVQKLTTAELGKLQDSYFLMPLFMVLASFSSLQSLIAKKNKKLGL